MSQPSRSIPLAAGFQRNRPNMFYTVTLPCTLWFFDRGKIGTERENTVLFLDARHLYRQIDRAHRDWSEAQIGFLAKIVRLYRGEAEAIEAQGWSLNPGRYVGVAAGEDLIETIAANVAGILGA